MANYPMTNTTMTDTFDKYINSYAPSIIRLLYIIAYEHVPGRVLLRMPQRPDYNRIDLVDFFVLVAVEVMASVPPGEWMKNVLGTLVVEMVWAWVSGELF